MNIVLRLWHLVRNGDDPEVPVEEKIERIELLTWRDELRELNGWKEGRLSDGAELNEYVREVST